MAVTTDLPARSALRIHSPAGSRPPINSTITSTSDESTSSMFSVQWMCGGNPSAFFWAAFFRAMLRLKMCVSVNGPLASWQSSLATERPTVPKPTSATLNFLPVLLFSPVLPGTVPFSGTCLFLE